MSPYVLETTPQFNIVVFQILTRKLCCDTFSEHLERSVAILKIATRSGRLLTFMAQVPLLRRLFVFRMDAIAGLKDPEIRDYVYTQIVTANYSTKQTGTGRFRDLDEDAISCMHEDSVNVIHDIGVSSGVTSLELLQTLRGRKLPVSFHISDKYAKY